MTEQFRMSVEREHETEARPLIRFEIHVHFENDAPPSLAKAIGQALATLICCGSDEEALQQIAADMQERQIQRQREADNVARMLLGEEDENPGLPYLR
jgi:hypothetical protein